MLDFGAAVTTCVLGIDAFLVGMVVISVVVVGFFVISGVVVIRGATVDVVVVVGTEVVVGIVIDAWAESVYLKKCRLLKNVYCEIFNTEEYI